MKSCELAVRMMPKPQSTIASLLRWLVARWSDENRAVVNDDVQQLFGTDANPDVFVCGSNEVVVVGICRHPRDVEKRIRNTAIARMVDLKSFRFKKGVVV